MLTTRQWLDRTRQEIVRVYLPVLRSYLCRYVSAPVVEVQDIPTWVVREHEDWEKEYGDIHVSAGLPQVESQPFQLKEFRSGQWVGVLASIIRDLQDLALQHFSIRNPVLATGEATRIFDVSPSGRCGGSCPT